MRWISSLWVPACVFIQTYVPHKHRCIHTHTHMSIATCICVFKKYTGFLVQWTLILKTTMVYKLYTKCMCFLF